MSSSSSSKKTSSSSSESGEEESGEPETFDMWEQDPIHHPSTKYLLKLEDKLKWHTRNDRSYPCSPYLIIYRNWVEKIDRYREMAKTGCQKCSTSHHFVGNELFSGFIERTHKGTDSPIFSPWDKPTREDMEEWMSRQARKEYRPKAMGLFSKTVNKFIQQNGFLGFTKPLYVLDLLPSTKENPWPARIADPQDGYYNPKRTISAIVLVGHDTVLAPKKDASIFLDLQNCRGCAFQLLCFDITFMGTVFPLYWKDRLTTAEENTTYYYPRFYGCTFTDTLALNKQTILVDCHGKKLIISPGNTCRLLNCKFDEVVVNVGRILAKGCEFGTLELVKGPKAKALYYLEECTIGETKKSAMEAPKFGWQGPPISQFTWDKEDPVALLRQAFDSIQEYSFKPAEFEPDA